MTLSELQHIKFKSDPRRIELSKIIPEGARLVCMEVTPRFDKRGRVVSSTVIVWFETSGNRGQKGKQGE